MARSSQGASEHPSERPPTDVSEGAQGGTPRGPADHQADDRLRETVVASRTVHTGHYLAVRVDDILTPEGKPSTRDIVEHPGAVAIVALDPEDRVLMVRQFRLAAGRTLLEIPAGTLDRAADGSLEEPDLAARRELEEETGFRAGSWEHLGAFWTAPGFATELMHLYLARDLVPVDVDRLGPDEDERLELEHLPWREAVAMAERGEIADAKSLVGLLRLARLLEVPAAVTDAPATGAAAEPGSGRLVSGSWRLGLGDFIHANAALVRMSRWATVLGVLLLASAVLLAVLGASPIWYVPMGAFGVLEASGYLIAPIVWWMVRRRRDLFEDTISIEADLAGFRMTSASGSGSQPWAAFRRVRESRGCFFLDTLAGAHLIIPHAAFDSPGLATFRRLLIDAGFSPDGVPLARS